ncbi:MAG: Fic family protein [Ramlibacter sp.]
MRSILVGRYRTNPMQIVSGPDGHETVHYQAPQADAVPGEMANFLAWFNAERGEDPLLKAALAHLWFETIHPFDDGNGRVGRNIVELCLAREAGESSLPGSSNRCAWRGSVRRVSLTPHWKRPASGPFTAPST